METLIVPPEAAGGRLDRFVALTLPRLSRSEVQRLVRMGAVTVDGAPARPSHLVRTGARIAVAEPEPVSPPTLRPEALPLDVIFSDEHLVVVNKPPGMVVHPGAGVRAGTLANALAWYFRTLSDAGGADRPGIVHRLDKETSGLLVVARDNRTHRALSEQFARRESGRVYEAIAWGLVEPPQGEVQAPVGRHPTARTRMAVRPEGGRPALTRYRTLRRFTFATHLELSLGTGRTHQLRVHCYHIGHPVFGDPVYGGREARVHQLRPSLWPVAREALAVMPRQALHARTLTFTHPWTGHRLQFEAPLPPDFQALLAHLREFASP